MAATVRFGGVSATFTAGAWSSRDAGLAEALNLVIPEQRGEDPNHSQTVADVAIAAMGYGEIVHVDDPETVERDRAY